MEQNVLSGKQMYGVAVAHSSRENPPTHLIKSRTRHLLGDLPPFSNKNPPTTPNQINRQITPTLQKKR